MRVWQSKTPAYISHTFFLRRPRGFNTTGPFLMCDLFWNLLSKQPYILQLLHFNSLSRRREHQTSTAPPGLAAGIGRHRDLHRSPLRFLTSTPKPRAEGSSPSAPAKNREASIVLASLFFVSAHKDSATRHGCALRSACRGVSERQWRSAANRPRRQPRPSPSAPATEPAKTLGFRRFYFFMCCMVIVFTLVRTPGFFTWPHPPLTVATLSSTQNAPGFAFFWLNRVRFRSF